MMELNRATVTSRVLRVQSVTQLEDSVRAGSTSLVVSARSVQQGTTASLTADVSEWFFVPVVILM